MMFSVLHEDSGLNFTLSAGTRDDDAKDDATNLRGKLLLALDGCSGITPDGELRNNREEGSEKGLFSGLGGEFVIVAPAAGTEEAGNKGENAPPTK